MQLHTGRLILSELYAHHQADPQEEYHIHIYTDILDQHTMSHCQVNQPYMDGSLGGLLSMRGLIKGVMLRRIREDVQEQLRLPVCTRYDYWDRAAEYIPVIYCIYLYYRVLLSAQGLVYFYLAPSG